MPVLYIRRSIRSVSQGTEVTLVTSTFCNVLHNVAIMILKRLRLSKYIYWKIWKSSVEK